MPSSDSLFHFTNSFDVLTSILTDKFYASYCKERLEYGNERRVQIVPKISFCDISDDNISNYSNYGKYGIGLKKDWGIRKRLNPVLYIEKHSMVAESMVNGFIGAGPAVNFSNKLVSDLTLYFHATKGDTNITDTRFNEIEVSILEALDTIEAFNNTINFSQYSPYYVKHYQDDLERSDSNGKKIIKDYRFYDEKEWCYVPDITTVARDHNLTLKQYIEWREQTKEKRILQDISLSFDWSDINLLIVERQEDISHLRKLLDTLPESQISNNDKVELISKIKLFDE